MPTYICSGEYAAADWEGTLADPAGWTEVVPDLAKRADAKLIGYYLIAAEDNDFVLILEAPDAITATAITAAVGGDRASVRVIEAMPAVEAATRIGRVRELSATLPAARRPARAAE